MTPLSAPTRLRSYGLTDRGRRRPLNEDAYACDDALGLYVVADGVGGHAKGEVASQESVEQIGGFVRQGRPLIDAFLRDPGRADKREQGRRVRGGAGAGGSAQGR